MGIMVYSLLWVMQGLYHQQYTPYMLAKVSLWFARIQDDFARDGTIGA